MFKEINDRPLIYMILFSIFGSSVTNPQYPISKYLIFASAILFLCIINNKLKKLRSSNEDIQLLLDCERTHINTLTNVNDKLVSQLNELKLKEVREELYYNPNSKTLNINVDIATNVAKLKLLRKELNLLEEKEDHRYHNKEHLTVLRFIRNIESKISDAVIKALGKSNDTFNKK